MRKLKVTPNQAGIELIQEIAAFDFGGRAAADRVCDALGSGTPGMGDNPLLITFNSKEFRQAMSVIITSEVKSAIRTMQMKIDAANTSAGGMKKCQRLEIV